jgi:hypothetical protein
VDRVDDLGVVDALEVDGRDPEVGVAELALDDDQRHTLAGHRDGVRVAELVWRKASPYAGLAGDAAQLRAGGGGRPLPPPRGTADDTELRPDRQLNAHLEPRRELFPGQSSIPTSRRRPPLPRRSRLKSKIVNVPKIPSPAIA